MHKLRILLILGIVVSVLPYSGFPYVFRNIFITLSGLGVIYLSYLLFEENKKEITEERPTFENFSENHDFVEKNLENDEISQKEMTEK